MPRKLTTEEFIEKARAVHGDKYDYSRVEYTGGKNKVTIICPLHGPFEQRPNSHSNGNGCERCAREENARKLNKGKEHFIRLARKQHGDKYDYSKVYYTKMKDEVCIICPEHGEFMQQAANHAHNGAGCWECGRVITISSRKHSKEDFIRKAKEVHGDRYGYAKVEYIDSTTKVILLCDKHGEFSIPPQAHLAGQGCRDCGYEINGKKAADTMFSVTNEEFIERAIAVHGNKYDYSKVDIKRWSSKTVRIICPEHGEFPQSAFQHVNRRQGCPDCAKVRTSIANSKSYDDFVLQARKKHKDRYLYTEDTKIHYGRREKDKVPIVCPVHGVFWQTPAMHLKSGCWDCANERWITQDSVFSLLQDNFSEYMVTGQYSHSLLKHKKNLRMDFALFSKGRSSEFPDLLVEHQGEQHFYPVFGSKSKRFKRWTSALYRDELKTIWAAEREIPIVYTFFGEEEEAIQERVEQALTLIEEGKPEWIGQPIFYTGPARIKAIYLRAMRNVVSGLYMLLEKYDDADVRDYEKLMERVSLQVKEDLKSGEFSTDSLSMMASLYRVFYLLGRDTRWGILEGFYQNGLRFFHGHSEEETDHIIAELATKTQEDREDTLLKAGVLYGPIDI